MYHGMTGWPPTPVPSFEIFTGCEPNRRSIFTFTLPSDGNSPSMVALKDSDYLNFSASGEYRIHEVAWNELPMSGPMGAPLWILQSGHG